MKPAFAYLLRTCRKERGLTQQRVSEVTGVPRRRISAFEKEDALPSPSERACLARFFGREPEAFGRIDPGCSHGERSYHPLPRRFLVSFGRGPRLFRPDRKISMKARIHSAIKDCRGFEPIARKALEDEQFAAFTRAATCDSGDEARLWVRLAHQGARHARVALTRLNWDGPPVLTYDARRCLCGTPWPVLFVTRPEKMVFFPQVPLRTPAGERRVDALVAVGRGRSAEFFVVEVNGGGHQGKRDMVRHKELNMPVIYLHPSDLDCPTMAELLLERYLPLKATLDAEMQVPVPVSLERGCDHAGPGAVAPHAKCS